MLASPSEFTCWLPRLVRSKLGRTIRATFDSNSWQQVVRPDKFPKDRRRYQLLALNRALKCGRLQGFLADVQATLEAIPRGSRGAYLAETTAHPGLKPILEEFLRDATNLHIQLLHTPRIGLPIPPGIGGYYVPQTNEEMSDRQARTFAAGRIIETKGIGKPAVEAIGHRIAARLGLTGPWNCFLDRPKNDQENNEIDDAVAEWADEDALAAHHGYRNDFFCSQDFGRAAVKRFGQSILDTSHRAWLTSTLGIQFVTVEELANLL